MDTEGVRFEVNELCIFNAYASFYRTHYIVGWITKISANGTLDLDVIKLDRSGAVTTAAASTVAISIPDYEDIVDHIRLQPKRGHEAGPGNYRYDKRDVYVDHYDVNKWYVENDYYRHRLTTVATT